jgi:hypothetical protein
MKTGLRIGEMNRSNMLIRLAFFKIWAAENRAFSTPESGQKPL